MPYCENCLEYKEKIVEVKIGTWGGYCNKYKIGRSMNSDICNKFTPNDKYDENESKLSVYKIIERISDRLE